MENPDQTTHYAKQIRNLVVGLFFLALVLFLDFAQDFILPVLLSFFIAITFRPAIRILARRYVPEWLAASAFISIAIATFMAFAFFFAGPIASLVQNAPVYAQTFGAKLRDLQASPSTMMRFVEKIQAAAQTGGASAAQEVTIREGPL